MKTIPIIQLGTGNVGREVIRQVIQQNMQSSDLTFVYTGIANSRRMLFNKDGLSESLLENTISSSEFISNFSNSDSQSHKGDLSPDTSVFDQPDLGRTVVIDTTDADSHIPFLLWCKEKGASIVLANKKPLVGKMDIFSLLAKTKLGCRATVGAGLPVIPVIKDLISESQTIIKIEGCFSGSLGILFTRLEKGESFSKIVNDLYVKGFTEPDPREDLSGMDQARKILILTRLAGYPIDIEDVRVKSLFPEDMKTLSLETFLRKIENRDRMYKDMFQKASAKNSTLRFTATFSEGECKVGLKEFPVDSIIGNITGSEKLALIETQNSSDPVVINGKGAGAEDAAKDVIADLLEVAFE